MFISTCLYDKPMLVAVIAAAQACYQLDLHSITYQQSMHLAMLSVTDICCLVITHVYEQQVLIGDSGLLQWHKTAVSLSCTVAKNNKASFCLEPCCRALVPCDCTHV